MRTRCPGPAVRSVLLPPLIATLAAAPLAAQAPADLARLGFMSGCWLGATTVRGGPGTIEERYTAPSRNVILGTTRYTTAAGLTTSFEFTLLQADSAGIVLVPFPGGRRSEHAFRLTRLAGDTATFEAPEHDYPRRISYLRDAAGALVARIDAGADDPSPRSWRLTRSTCGPADAFASGPAPERPGGGRTELIVFETLHGLFLGLAVPIILDANSSAPYGLGLLLGGPTGLVLSRAWAEANQPSAGQARAVIWGGTWGALSGLFLYGGTTNNQTAQGSFGAMTAGMLGGTLAGGIAARRPISGGDGTLVIHSTVWGGWFGLALAAMADDQGEAWLPMLIGGNAGLVAAAMAARRVEMSSGRVWLVTATGLAGLVAGLGVDILVQPDDGTLAIAIPAAASFIGLAAGVTATREFDRGRLAQAEGPAMGALLAVRNGRARLGIPVPTPALVPVEDGSPRLYTPGFRFTLFDLRQ